MPATCPAQSRMHGLASPTHWRIWTASRTMLSMPERTLQIAIELPGNITFDMSGEQYARDWALPQFYFHVITAYAILRHYGITLGKADYVPHMFAYLRPGSLPSA